MTYHSSCLIFSESFSFLTFAKIGVAKFLLIVSAGFLEVIEESLCFKKHQGYFAVGLESSGFASYLFLVSLMIFTNLSFGLPFKYNY